MVALSNVFVSACKKKPRIDRDTKRQLMNEVSPSQQLLDEGTSIEQFLNEEAVEGSIVDQDYTSYDTVIEFDEAVRGLGLIRVDLPGIKWAVYMEPGTGMYRAYSLNEKGVVYAKGFETISGIVT